MAGARRGEELLWIKRYVWASSFFKKHYMHQCKIHISIVRDWVFRFGCIKRNHEAKLTSSPIQHGTSSQNSKHNAEISKNHSISSFKVRISEFRIKRKWRIFETDLEPRCRHCPAAIASTISSGRRVVSQLRRSSAPDCGCAILHVADARALRNVADDRRTCKYTIKCRWFICKRKRKFWPVIGTRPNSRASSEEVICNRSLMEEKIRLECSIYTTAACVRDDTISGTEQWQTFNDKRGDEEAGYCC